MKKRAFDALKNIAYAAKETLCIGTARERERNFVALVFFAECNGS